MTKSKLNEIKERLTATHIFDITMLAIIALSFIITTCLVILTINSFVIITALYKIVECLEKIAGKYF
jgi:hypothetical protein